MGSGAAWWPAAVVSAAGCGRAPNRGLGGTGEATQNRVRQVRVRQVSFRWQSRSFGARRSGSMAVGPSWLRGRAVKGTG